MNEFINEFGKENFMIIVVVVGIIVLALIVIVLIEKIQIKSKMKKCFQKSISDIKDVTIKEEEKEVINANYSTYNDIKDDSNDSFNTQEVVYEENVNPEKVAKEKLAEVTKKLIDNDDSLIDHTHFEVEQEEKSIISYEELVKSSHDIDYKNDKLLQDEGEAAITLEELYKKHEDEQNIVLDSNVKVNNPVFEDDEPKKFKNSEVISPVFGFYNGKIKNEKTGNDVLKRMNNDITSKELDEEIQKSEDFLVELRKLQSKLD